MVNAVFAVRESNLPFFDTENIGMLGHSMGGGILVNILVTHPDLVDAAVLFAPVSATYRDNFDKWTRRRSEEAGEILALYGGFKENPEFWDAISPIHFLSTITAPIMLHHGTLDESVPLKWSDALASSLELENKEITYYIYPNEPHEFINAWPEVMELTRVFFDQHLKN